MQLFARYLPYNVLILFQGLPVKLITWGDEEKAPGCRTGCAKEIAGLPSLHGDPTGFRVPRPNKIIVSKAIWNASGGRV
jgi:hypothetical protein